MSFSGQVFSLIFLLTVTTLFDTTKSCEDRVYGKRLTTEAGISLDLQYQYRHGLTLKIYRGEKNEMYIQ